MQLKTIFMKKIVLGLLLPFLLQSCSNDSSSSSSDTYSIEGTWKTTSTVVNGVENFGGTNIIKSELTYFYAGGDFYTEAYTDTNYSNLRSYSEGTYTFQSASTFNLSANAYNSSDVLTGIYNVSCQILKLNATQLEIKVTNLSNPNEVSVKKFIK
jgi:hypothetical protein